MTEAEGKTERERFHDHWFAPQMATLAESGPGLSAGSPSWVLGPATFPRPSQGAGLEVERPGLEPASLQMLASQAAV